MKVKNVAFDGDNLVVTYESAEAEDTNQEFEEIIPLPPRVAISGATVFSGSSPASWTDLDLSSVVGENSAFVLLEFVSASDMDAIAVRKNGDSTEYFSDAAEANAYGCALAHHEASTALVLMCITDAAGVVEWRTESAQTATVKLIAYIK